MSDVAKVLRELAGVGERIAPKAPSALGSALELGALGLGLVAKILDAGGDPRVVIPRLETHLLSIFGVQASRPQRLEERFGTDTEPSGPPSPPSHELADEDDVDEVPW